ncbi:MAG: phenylacetate--CoA ligase family protein [Myxococcales bacterium]|nr:phenylacetate--CoA ligase family protein [Myxococcales bacterium]
MRSAYRALPEPLRKVAQTAYGAVPFPWNRGLQFGAHHQRFWRSQAWPRERLEALQLRELKRMAQHARQTVPAYRRIFAEIGFDPEAMRSLADWTRLPLTTKAQIQDDPEAYVSRAIPPAERQRRTTSGSTGTPLVLYSTNDTHVAESAMMYRGWRWSGLTRDDRVVTCVGELTGDELGPRHAPYARYRNHIEISPHHLSEEAVRSYVDLIREFAPAYLRTYPSIAQLFGKLMRDEGITPPPLRGIWTQSEALLDCERRLVEEQWGTRVYDYYGMQEKCLAMSECEHGRMHVHCEFGHVELLPSEHPPYAHVVATGFYNPAMPLLRYQTRDLAIPDDRPCPCGRALPTVARIVGRLEDFLLASDGSQVMEADAAIAELTTIRECQIIQESLSACRVLVVPGPGYSAETERELTARLRCQLGEEVSVTVERLTAIPRTATGKQRFIVSKVKPGWAL